MNQILDIIGSMVLGGIILIMVIGFNGNITQSAGTQTFYVNVQTNMTEATKLLEADLRLLGYQNTVHNDTNRITFADTGKIVFKEDMDDNGTLDSISYYLGTTMPPGVDNPRVRMLYRRVNTNAPQAMNLGVTRLRFWYYDGAGNVTSTLSMIRIIKASISMESLRAYNHVYSGAYWERVIQPKNLIVNAR